MLARYFVDRYCRDLNKKPLMFAPTAVDEMQTYPWPGNVRELQNCMERAVILTEGDTIHGHHLNLSFRGAAIAAPPPEVSPWEQIDLSGSMSEMQRRVLAEAEHRKIAQTVKDAAGNKGRAAEILQMPYKLLIAKMREYGLE